MRTISNIIIFTMAVYAGLNVFVTAPNDLATNTTAHVEYQVASR